MKQFIYTITITKDDKTVKTSRLMKLMSLTEKQGNTVTAAAEGSQEEEPSPPCRSS